MGGSERAVLVALLFTDGDEGERKTYRVVVAGEGFAVLGQRGAQVGLLEDGAALGVELLQGARSVAVANAVAVSVAGKAAIRAAEVIGRVVIRQAPFAQCQREDEREVLGCDNHLFGSA